MKRRYRYVGPVKGSMFSFFLWSLDVTVIVVREWMTTLELSWDAAGGVGAADLRAARERSGTVLCVWFHKCCGLEVGGDGYGAIQGVAGRRSVSLSAAPYLARRGPGFLAQPGPCIFPAP